MRVCSSSDFCIRVVPTQSESVRRPVGYDTAPPGALPDRQAIAPQPVRRHARPNRLLLGGTSPQSIGNAAHRLEHALPAGALTVLDGQTHMLKPKVTVPVVREFFASGLNAAGDVEAQPPRDGIRRPKRSTASLAPRT